MLPNEPLDTFKYIRCFIHFSKERPPMYGGSPEGLESMWLWLDHIFLHIVGRDYHSYSMDRYAMENGYKSGAIGLSHYYRNNKRISDDKEIYRLLVETRDKYDEWLMKTLVEEEPKLAPFCENFDYKKFFDKCRREMKVLKTRV